VISLDATDDFLKARVMNLPESVVAGTHNTEEGTFRVYGCIYYYTVCPQENCHSNKIVEKSLLMHFYFRSSEAFGGIPRCEHRR
jgi:hypothetical protein